MDHARVIGGWGTGADMCVCQVARMERCREVGGNVSKRLFERELEEKKKGTQGRQQGPGARNGPRRHAERAKMADQDKYGQDATPVGGAPENLGSARPERKAKPSGMVSAGGLMAGGREVPVLVHPLGKDVRIVQRRWGRLWNAGQRSRGSSGRMRAGNGRGKWLGPPARLVSGGYYWIVCGARPGNLQAQGERDRLSRIWDPRSAARQSSDPCDRKYDARSPDGTSTLAG